MSLLRTENLTKHYGRRVGIESLDLEVGEGAIFGFLGPNGAGKTTTIRVLLGLLRPTAGRASIFGRDCVRESARIKRETGYLPGDLRLYPWMTAQGALRLFGRVRGRDLEGAGLELAERLGLAVDVPVRKMSRGMKQKLGLVLTMAHGPRLLILDEPSTSLDPLTQQTLYSTLRERAANGATVFFSSHTLSEVEELCDRVAVLREGRLIADERLEDLRRRAKRVVVLTWREETEPGDLPGFLKLAERRGSEWHCELEGDAMETVRWAAGQPLADMAIGEPELETLFRRFYRDSEEGGDGP